MKLAIDRKEFCAVELLNSEYLSSRQLGTGAVVRGDTKQRLKLSRQFSGKLHGPKFELRDGRRRRRVSPIDLESNGHVLVVLLEEELPPLSFVAFWAEKFFGR